MIPKKPAPDLILDLDPDLDLIRGRNRFSERIML
jgi:hypothetical protein